MKDISTPTLIKKYSCISLHWIFDNELNIYSDWHFYDYELDIYACVRKVFLNERENKFESWIFLVKF